MLSTTPSYFCGSTVYWVSSDNDLGDLDLYSCQRIDGVILQGNVENAFDVKWANTTCGDCKAEGGKSETGTLCFHLISCSIPFKRKYT